MWWNCRSALVAACRHLVAGLLLAVALAPTGPANAQSGGVDELVQLLGARGGMPPAAADPCVSAAGDELVLKAGRPCDLDRVASVIRKAVARQDRRGYQAITGGCVITDGCAGRRDNLTRLSHYSARMRVRSQLQGPRYFGQKD